MINGDWPLDRARAMARRLIDSKPDSDQKLIEQAYAITYSRQPTPDEQSAALAFVKEQRRRLNQEKPKPAAAPEAALADAAGFFTGTSLPAKTTKTLWMQPGSPNEKLRIESGDKREGRQFTVEALVNLGSLYPNGSVRTIASRWDK